MTRMRALQHQAIVCPRRSLASLVAVLSVWSAAAPASLGNCRNATGVCLVAPAVFLEAHRHDGTSAPEDVLLGSTRSTVDEGQHKLPEALSTHYEGQQKLPEALSEHFEQLEYLGEGGYGKTWAVKHKKKKGKLVIKVLLDGGQFITGQQVRKLPKRRQNRSTEQNALADLFVQALNEFDAIQKIQEGPSNTEGAAFFMKSYHGIKHAIQLGTTDPLYLKLQYCGNQNLDQYRKNPENKAMWKPDLVMRIYKQLIVALTYLGEHKDHWVHHDIKPSNIVIKEKKITKDGKTRDGKKEADICIVDMGAAVRGLEGKQWKITPATGGYYPKEWKDLRSQPSTHVLAPINFEFDPKGGEKTSVYAQSFDVFSAAVTFIELVTRENWRDNLNFDGLTLISQYPDAAVQGMLCDMMEADFRVAFCGPSSGPYKVLIEAVKCLTADASKRPTAPFILSILRKVENAEAAEPSQ